MALTLSDLQTERDKIIQQMSTPEETRLADRFVRYRTGSDLEGALKRIDSEIAKVSQPGATKFTIQTSRGL